MSRTIAQIKASIIAAKNADTDLSGLTSTSKVAEWNLWIDIVSVCQWTLENLFDLHVNEVNNIIANMKPHTLQWYVNKAKVFQYGDALSSGSDAYDTIDSTKQIVTYAAATEINNTLRIKVAKAAGNSLSPLTNTELTAFMTYMNLVKDAGVRLTITSGNADRFIAGLKIFYDPLVLDNTGKRLDGTDNTPIQNTITAFLEGLPFNGLFVLNYFIDAVQKVPGVVICQVLNVQATYASLPLSAITYEYLPDAGYMNIDLINDLSLTFIAHNPV